jgi:branched-subunit amino acid transport protein
VSPGVWLVVGAVGVATIAIKGAGPVMLGGRELPAPVRRVVAALAPAVLAALVAIQTFADGRRLVLDARAAGLAAAAIALLLRAPILLVVVVAAATTAAVRALA